MCNPMHRSNRNEDRFDHEAHRGTLPERIVQRRRPDLMRAEHPRSTANPVDRVRYGCRLFPFRREWKTQAETPPDSFLAEPIGIRRRDRNGDETPRHAVAPDGVSSHGTPRAFGESRAANRHRSGMRSATVLFAQACGGVEAGG